MADQPVIIIRRKKKGGHAAHHGGAWKVAYADFVTAMMSFFLLLWLLNVTTSEQRKGLADYFAPAGISKSSSGAGGMFGGQSITTASGAEMADRSPPSLQATTIPTMGQGEQGDEDTKGKSDHGGGDPNSSADAVEPNKSLEVRNVASAMKAEEESFGLAEATLKQAIMSSPDLQPFANQIVVDRTNEGLRIQIVDREKFSMFPAGNSIPYAKARDLLVLIGRVVARLPNKISITGHTDSTPFTVGSRRDNWSLSTERANVSREYIIKAGVDEQRISRISGLADRDPFVADPKDPRNRRISIVLLRQSLPPAPEMPLSKEQASAD